jgi:hypothetical protein
LAYGLFNDAFCSSDYIAVNDRYLLSLLILTSGMWPVEVYQCFGGTQILLSSSSSSKSKRKPSKKEAESTFTVVHSIAGVNEQKNYDCRKCFAGLLLPLNPDDAGSMFLRNAELLDYSNRCETLKSNTVINNSAGCE